MRMLLQLQKDKKKSITLEGLNNLVNTKEQTRKYRNVYDTYCMSLHTFVSF